MSKTILVYFIVAAALADQFMQTECGSVGSKPKIKTNVETPASAAKPAATPSLPSQIPKSQDRPASTACVIHFCGLVIFKRNNGIIELLMVKLPGYQPFLPPFVDLRVDPSNDLFELAKGRVENLTGYTNNDLFTYKLPTRPLLVTKNGSDPIGTVNWIHFYLAELKNSTQSEPQQLRSMEPRWLTLQGLEDLCEQDKFPDENDFKGWVASSIKSLPS